ncbi:GH20032 [Drosophila grimshawi]|uniref:GH20032 n=2 Tax=Drosophila grimshawi TaxID=7222 RepID=B4J7P7_DROGR|nr:GH20032 [Drosophila grimshawi]
MIEPRLTTYLMNPSIYSIHEKNALAPVLSMIQRKHEGIEVTVLRELLHLDEAYRTYYREWLKELGLQRIAAETLHPLNQELLLRSDSHCRRPAAINAEGDDAMIKKYQLHYQIILGSNQSLNRGIKNMRSNLIAFRRAFNKLDLNDETPLILGDAFHKPVKFFIGLVKELFNYFYSHFLKLDCGANMLDPADINALESYQKLLTPSEEFEEYLLHNLGYCHCLRPPQPCPERPTVTPMPGENKENKRRAQLSRCNRRVIKMSMLREESHSELDHNHSTYVNASDLENELRMNQLSSRIALLRDGAYSRQAGRERGLVHQMIYALSPSLVASNY